MHSHSSAAPAEAGALSPYARIGARLVDMGYSAIPVRPGCKWPGEYKRKQWANMPEWDRFSDRLPTEIETGHWSRWPDAGVGIVLDRTVKVIDVDTDDGDIRAALEAVLPDSPVRKRGKKGYSAFYRGAESIGPRKFHRPGPGGKTVNIVEILACGN
jgi:hypothetical protein